MKRVWIAVAVAVLILGVGGAVAVLRPAEPEPVKVAAIVPMTGPASDTRAVANGLELAASRINRAGGVAGRPLELIMRDNGGDVQRARLLFGEMEQREKPLVYFSVTSAVGRGLAPIAENSDAPLISLVATDPYVAADRDWVFRFFPSAEEEARTILRLMETSEIDRLAIAYVNDPFGRSIRDAVRARLPEGVTVAPFGFPRSASRFSTLAEELLGYPAVLLAGFSDQVVKLNQALIEADYRGFRYAISSAALPSRRSAAQGLYVAAPALYNANNVFASEVNREYTREYGEAISHYAANGYDALHIVAGLLRDGPVTRDALRAALERGFIYPGVVGEVVVEPNSHSFGFELQPARITNSWSLEFLP